MAIQSHTKRSLLVGFIFAIVLCGIVGIYCLIQRRLGWLEERILATTALAAATLILSFAGLFVLDDQRWRAVGVLALVLPVVAFFSTMPLIWSSYTSWYDRSLQRYLEKASVSAWVLGIVVVHIGLLSLARLDPKFAWIKILTILVISSLAGVILYLVCAEPRYPDEEYFMRAIGVLAILDVCGSVAVLFLHRISTLRKREEVRTVELRISLTCPRCKAVQEMPAGASRCVECGLRIVIDIEEEICPKCGYSLYRLESDRCPECGASAAPATVP